MPRRTRDTVEREIETAVTKTEVDHLRETVKIHLVKEKIEVSELVGYTLATITVAVWVMSSREIIYFFIAGWMFFVVWWVSLYWKLYRLKTDAKREETIRDIVARQTGQHDVLPQPPSRTKTEPGLQLDENTPLPQAVPRPLPRARNDRQVILIRLNEDCCDQLERAETKPFRAAVKDEQ